MAKIKRISRSVAKPLIMAGHLRLAYDNERGHNPKARFVYVTLGRGFEVLYRVLGGTI